MSGRNYSIAPRYVVIMMPREMEEMIDFASYEEKFRTSRGTCIAPGLTPPPPVKMQQHRPKVITSTQLVGEFPFIIKKKKDHLEFVPHGCEHSLSQREYLSISSLFVCRGCISDKRKGYFDTAWQLQKLMTSFDEDCKSEARKYVASYYASRTPVPSAEEPKEESKE